MKTLAFILLAVALAACACFSFSLAPELLAVGRIELALLAFLAPMIAISVASLAWIFIADTSWPAPHERSGERLHEGRCPVRKHHTAWRGRARPGAARHDMAWQGL